MIGFGPFPFKVIIVLLAVLIAWATARALAKHKPDATPKTAGGMILDSVLWGTVTARLGYIAQWWDEYSATPASMLAIGDGGFVWWVGVLAALTLIAWKTRRSQAARVPTLAGITAGVLAWFAAGSVVQLLHHAAPPLPTLELATLDENPVNLATYAGRPIVLNLWTSWCPPCRREMPVFQQAQAMFPKVAFVMVNQGESAQQTRAFLQHEQLALRDVLLDPASMTMQTLGTRGLPTTMFFDEQGRLAACRT